MTEITTTEPDTTEPEEDTTTTTEPDDTAVDDAAEPDPNEDNEGEQQPKRGVRQRLADAEFERDELRETLAATNAALFAIAAERVQVTPELMTARGLVAEDFATGPNGVVDLNELVAAMQRERDQLGLPRKPQPNPMAGRTNTSDQAAAPTTFGEVLREHARAAGTAR